MINPLFVPYSDWQLPDCSNLPGFKSSSIIGLDIESCDPNIKTLGPGFVRNDAHVVGVSLARDDGMRIYLPIAHKSGTNLDRDKVIAYLQDQLGTNTPKVGANILYDIEGLSTLGIEVAGDWLDIQTAQPIIIEDTAGGVSLENLSRLYLNTTKDEALLREAAAAYGLDPKSELYKLAPEFVGPYAETDAWNPIEIYSKQKALLDNSTELSDLFKLETRLLKVIFKMRKRGVRVDIAGAYKLHNQWVKEEDELFEYIRKLYPFAIEVWGSKFLERVCEFHGIMYPTTAKGNPSITNEFLLSTGLDALIKLANLRKLNKMRKDFIDGIILKYSCNERIHAQYHPLRNDKWGTVSGRFSSSNPNLQQIPARDPVYGPQIRSLFVADKDEIFCAADYSGQELRLATHFAFKANATGSQDVVNSYCNNPDFDLHGYCANLMSVERRQAKDLNFLILYGGGPKKLAERLHVSETEAERLFYTYKRNFPCFSETAEMASNVAKSRGYVKTLLKRRRYFSGNTSAHKAFNAIIQGSAADQIKKVMVDLDDAGITPLMTVHDELTFSLNHLRLVDDIKEIMEHAIDVTVPMPVSIKTGSNWSECK